jgi:protein-S-isoprenylcysteine O-methyltransferase Ste14
MELLPPFEVGWLNGWFLLAILYGIFGLLLLLFPRPVVSRLYDRTGWTRTDYLRRVIGLPIILSYFALIILLPLRESGPALVAGLLVYGVGLAGFIIALLNYRNTPLDRPVTDGLYHISRNPQVVGLLIAFLGAALATGSWLAVALVILMAPLMHTRILAEERACLGQYGDAFRAYMEQTPRYFVFF